MKPSYIDIISKLGAPKWWDANGVPRYCDPHPKNASCIYAQEVAFAEIQCQSCCFMFVVEFNSGIFDPVSMAEKIANHKLHYGDPPNYFLEGVPEPHCCHAGATMTSDMVRVVSFWKRDMPGDWKIMRIPGDNIWTPL